MSKNITIYSFIDVDRSGKVRWTACELDYEIEEQRVKPGNDMEPDYLQLNPYAMVPTAVIDGQTLIESTATCILLAEKHPEKGLIPGESPNRTKFWQQISLTSSTLELPVVNYYLSKLGIFDEQWQHLLGKGIRARLKTFAAGLPENGYLCGTFSIADICAAYVLRIAVQAELLPYTGTLVDYLDRLRARPAAKASRIFDSLET